jgi:hypothetical protein
MSFAKRWEKLSQNVFTTFRYPRKDADWREGEKVQIFIKNRSPNRLYLGNAEIISKVSKEVPAALTVDEARADGFDNIQEMEAFMRQYYGRDFLPRFNKLTLIWI